jgi:hypothetical protein
MLCGGEFFGRSPALSLLEKQFSLNLAAQKANFSLNEQKHA